MRFDLQGYLDAKLGIRHVSHGDSGEEYVVACPTCGKAKLYANPLTGLWTCYKCGEGGGLVSLVMRVDACDDAKARQIVSRGSRPVPGRALADLRAASDDAKDRTTKAMPAVTDPDAMGLPDGYVPVWDPGSREWTMPQYLRDRGIRARTAATYGLGVVPAGRCAPPGCRDQPLRCDRCRYANRVILPCRVNGAVRYFQARAMDPDARLKYLGPATPKGAVLFGLDEAVGPAQALVVEGPFDVLALAQRGHTAVALMGKSCSQGQAALLSSAGFTSVILMLDGDTWETPKTRSGVITAATTLAGVLDVQIAILPPDLDPATAPDDVLADTLASARPPSMLDKLGRGGGA
jgi:hypothetical protein